MPVDVMIPVLGYDNVPQAIDWLTRVFGFTERWRVGDHRAQLAVTPTSAVAIVEQPGKYEPNGDHVMIRVKDIETHYQRATQGGAEIVAALANFPYGEKQYAARDHVGRGWVFTESIQDVAPEDWGGTSAE